MREFAGSRGEQKLGASKVVETNPAGKPEETLNGKDCPILGMCVAMGCGVGDVCGNYKQELLCPY